MIAQYFFLTALFVAPLLLVAFGLATYFFRPAFLLWCIALSFTFQFHAFPVAGIYPSLTLLAGLALWGAVFRVMKIQPAWWLWALIFMIAWRLVAAAWSPSPALAIRNTIYAAPFIFITVAMAEYAAAHRERAVSLVKWAFVFAAAQSVLVIVFRILPSLELTFLSSPLARIFISPNALGALFGLSANNVFAADKSGGFFLNANVAGAFVGACAVASWYVSKVASGSLLRVVSIVHWVAVFFTGSKAGAITAVVLPLLLLAISYLRVRRLDPVRVVLGCVILSCAAIAAPIAFGAFQQTGFTHASVETLLSRQVIWDFAFQQFSVHPLLGLGHGGWEEKFAFYAYTRGMPEFPPHNAFLILWAEAGSLAVVLGMLFVLGLLRWTWIARRTLPAPDAPLASALLGAFSWVFLQSLGENYGLIGEAHLTPMLALLLGLVMGRASAPAALPAKGPIQVPAPFEISPSPAA